MTEGSGRVAAEIGARIRALRLERKWSQEALAREIQMSRMTILTAENGQSIPEWDTLERIAEAFEMELPDLLPQGKQGLTQLFGDFLRSATWTPASVV